MIPIDIFKINNDWDIGYTRRSVIEECKKMGFSATEIGEISIGNIEFRYILNGKTERFISTKGILGASSINKVRVHRKSYEKNAIITMCSDGIQNKWDFTSYSDKDLSTPSVFTRSILQDFGKNNDEVTVLVAVL